MTEAWFDRPMLPSDVPHDDQPPVITACCCAREFYEHGFIWECPKHGNVSEGEYVVREGLDGLEDPCPCCVSYRVLRDNLTGSRECLNCYESWEVD